MCVGAFWGKEKNTATSIEPRCSLGLNGLKCRHEGGEKESLCVCTNQDDGIPERDERRKMEGNVYSDKKRRERAI